MLAVWKQMRTFRRPTNAFLKKEKGFSAKLTETEQCQKIFPKDIHHNDDVWDDIIIMFLQNNEHDDEDDYDESKFTENTSRNVKKGDVYDHVKTGLYNISRTIFKIILSMNNSWMRFWETIVKTKIIEYFQYIFYISIFKVIIL